MSQLLDSVADFTDKRNRDTLDVTMASVLFDLLAPQRMNLWRVIEHEGSLRLRLRAGLSAGQPIAISDPALDPGEMPQLDSRPELRACYDANAPLHAAPDAKGRIVCAFPVATERQVVGLLEVEASRPWSAEHDRLVHGMLRIYRNYLAVLDYSEHDELTGLLNRKTFESAFERVLTRNDMPDPPARGVEWIGRRATPPADAVPWLAVVDIDFFKRINDRFGHLYGDEVLLLLARLMRATFRADDLLFRFGGEEFVLLLARLGEDEAGPVIERFRKRVEQFDFPQIGQVTISVGYTQMAPADNASAAFDRADEALYYAKQHGRNCSYSYEILLGSGAIAPKPVRQDDVELF